MRSRSDLRQWMASFRSVVDVGRGREGRVFMRRWSSSVPASTKLVTFRYMKTPGELRKIEYPIPTAFRMVKEGARRTFVESVDMAVLLQLDPRKPEQNIKGSCVLPHGTGKKIRLAVFAPPDSEEERIAKELGVEHIGYEDLARRITDGDVNFDRILATPVSMPVVGKLGRILGPRGLMPNEKQGTLTKDLASAIERCQQGQINFKLAKDAHIHVSLGKINFEINQLLENCRAFILSITQLKPDTIKGRYLKQVFVSSSMGKRGYRIDLDTLDPGSRRFLRDD